MTKYGTRRSIPTMSIMLVKGTRTRWFSSVMNAVRWLKRKTNTPSNLPTLDRHLTECRKHRYGRQHIFGFKAFSAGTIRLNHEQWKKVKGFDGYQVSNLGRIRSEDRVIYRGTSKVHRSGQILKLSTTRHHIVQAHLHRKRHTITRDIGDLVARAFVPNPYGNKEVLHLDENSFNNCAYNLRWKTRYQINNYGHRTQLTYRPIKMTRAGRIYVFPSLMSGAKWLKVTLSKTVGTASIHSLLGSCASENTMYSHAYGFTVDYIKDPELIEVIKNDQYILNRRLYSFTKATPAVNSKSDRRATEANL